MRTILSIAVVLGAVFLGACAGAPPVSVHPLEKFEDHRPEWAIVLIDLDLETSTSMINSSTLILPSNPTREVFAIYADVGKSFRLKRLSIPARPGYSADLTFPNSKELPLPRPGVYYYGRVEQRGGVADVDYKLAPQVIGAAMAKYPAMFTKLEPVNFQLPLR